MPSTSLAAARSAIVALVHAYPRLQDTADFEGIGKLFAKGRFSSTMGRSLGGAELAADRARGIRLHEDGTPRTSILTTNLLIDIDDAAGAARARSYYALLKQPPGEPLRVVGAGRYYDDFVREDGEWRFEERVSLFDLSGDVGGFLRAAPGRQPSLALHGPVRARAAAAASAAGRDGRDRGADLHLRGADRPRGPRWRRGAVRARALRRRERRGRGLRAARRGAGEGPAAARSGSTRATRARSTSRPTSPSRWTRTAGSGLARSYFVVLQQTPELPLQPIVSGRYRDRFERVDGVWRFAERRVRTDHMGDLSAHLRARGGGGRA